MGRPPRNPAEIKIRIVSSILVGEINLVGAARREQASKQSTGGRQVGSLDGGRAALVAGESVRRVARCGGSPDLFRFGFA